MDQVLERPQAPEAISEIEATLNYLVNDGVKIFTEAGGAGALDVPAPSRHPQRASARERIRFRTRGFPFRRP